MRGFNPAAAPFGHSYYDEYGTEGGSMSYDPCASEFYPTARPSVVGPVGHMGHCFQQPPSYQDAYTDAGQPMDFQTDSWLNGVRAMQRPLGMHQSAGYSDVSGQCLSFDGMQTPIDQHAGYHEPQNAPVKLDAKAPAFTPAKFSKLNATAPSFLISRLAIFDPLSDDQPSRPKKCRLVLPHARQENITDYHSMLANPQDGQVGRFTVETTYKFNKGLHRNDRVLAAIYNEIIALRKKNMGFFAVRLEVNSVNDAPPLWLPGQNLFDAKAYYFEPKKKYGDKDMFWVTILPNGSPPNADTIHVYETGTQKWVVLGQWLRDSYCSKNNFLCASRLKQGANLAGRPRYSTQFKWWKYTGSSHCFENLPTEIRTKIYKYALGGELYPLGSSRVPHITLGLGYHCSLFRSGGNFESVMDRMHNVHVPEDRPFVYEPQVSMLGLNRKIRDEVLHTAWALMRSCFIDRGLFEGAINAQPGAAKPYKYLGKVELNFTNYGYFRFFGVDMGTDHLYIAASASLGPRLQTLENLHDLHLRFRTPSDGYMGSASEHIMNDEFRPEGDCQRTVVDWICTFAYPFLVDKCKEGKLKVTLTGTVKTDTKEKWEAIFKNKREHDQSAAMAKILNKPRKELPPPCHCGTKCQPDYPYRDESGGFVKGDSFDPDT